MSVLFTSTPALVSFHDPTPAILHPSLSQMKMYTTTAAIPAPTANDKLSSQGRWLDFDTRKTVMRPRSAVGT